MKIAFSTISCPDYTAAEVARAVREYGYDGVELFALAGERLTPAMLADHLDEVRRALGDVPVVSINSWSSLSSEDPDERAVTVRRVASAMESATELECPIVKVFGGEFPSSQAPNTVLDYVASSVEQLGARGRELGVRLAIETHDGFSRGEMLRALLDRVSEAEYVGALWDVHHPYRVGETVQQTSDLIGDRVIHAHVKDAVRDGVAWEYRRLGAGELPVEAMLHELAARGFTGHVSVDWEKMWHPELEAPGTVLPHFAQQLRQYLKRVPRVAKP